MFTANPPAGARRHGSWQLPSTATAAAAAAAANAAISAIQEAASAHVRVLHQNTKSELRLRHVIRAISLSV